MGLHKGSDHKKRQEKYTEQFNRTRKNKERNKAKEMKKKEK